MPGNQPMAAESSCQDPLRWSHADIAAALDEFFDLDAPSRRAFAQQHAIPHATLDYWLNHFAPSADDPVDCFFRSTPGELVLRRILCSAVVTFSFQGSCGI